MNKHTVFRYSYTDHTGVEIFNDLLLEGCFNDEQLDEINNYYFSDGVFIVEQIPIPAISHILWDILGGANEHDGYFHKYIGIFESEILPSEKNIIWGTTDSFMAELEETKGYWSANYFEDGYIYSQKGMTSKYWESETCKNMFILNDRIRSTLPDRLKKSLGICKDFIASEQKTINFESVNFSNISNNFDTIELPAKISVSMENRIWRKIKDSIREIPFDDAAIEIYNSRDIEYSFFNDRGNYIDPYLFDEPLEFSSFRIRKPFLKEPILHFILQTKYYDSFFDYELSCISKKEP